MSGVKVIHQNKRAGYDYQLLEKVEAGIVLVGTEVKSIRLGKANITEAFVTISNGEAWIHQMQIAHYSHGNQFNHEEFRKRKLLLSREQIKHISLKSQKDGLHIIPLSLYFKKSLVKVELALAKSKKLYDKRHSEREKEVKKNLKQGHYE
jgi:SsrA-binding protein